MKKIVISNCWSYYNKGDLGILSGTIELLNDIIKDEKKYSCLSINSNGFTENVHKFGDNIEFIPMPSMLPFNNLLLKLYYGVSSHNNILVKEVLGILFIYFQLLLFLILKNVNQKTRIIFDKIDNSDLFISVGGNYLWSHVGLPVHLIPIVYAIQKRKKIILLGHSIGPFHKGILERYMRFILNQVDHIFVREKKSKTYITKNMGIIKNVSTIGDLAFYLSNNALLIEKNTYNKVGITIRQSLFDKPKKYKNYIDVLINNCKKLIDNNYDIYVIPFSYEISRENDINVSNYVYDKLREYNVDKVKTLDLENLSPIEILKLFNSIGFEFIIGTRLHSSIFSMILDIPSINISYQHFKSFGIYEQLEMLDYVIKIEDVNNNDLSYMISSTQQNNSQIRNTLKKNIMAINKNTYNKTKKIILNLITH